jgi:hypothetical protein
VFSYQLMYNVHIYYMYMCSVLQQAVGSHVPKNYPVNKLTYVNILISAWFHFTLQLNFTCCTIYHFSYFTVMQRPYNALQVTSAPIIPQQQIFNVLYRPVLGKLPRTETLSKKVIARLHDYMLTEICKTCYGYCG